MNFYWFLFFILYSLETKLSFLRVDIARKSPRKLPVANQMRPISQPKFPRHEKVNDTVNSCAILTGVQIQLNKQPESLTPTLYRTRSFDRFGPRQRPIAVWSVFSSPPAICSAADFFAPPRLFLRRELQIMICHRRYGVWRKVCSSHYTLSFRAHF